jgi:hypothetical protein
MALRVLVSSMGIALGTTDANERRNAREVNHPLYDSRGGDAVSNQYTQ